MPKIFINISRKYNKHDYYETSYNNLFKNHGIITYLFFDKNLSTKINQISNNSYTYVFYYNDKIDLINQLKLIKKSDIYYINTFDEVIVLLVNEVKKELWFKISTHYEAFRDKKLQRQLLLEKYPNLTVSYHEIDLEKDEIDSFYNKLSFPYIIKPISWAQSSGVVLINNKTQLEKYLENVDQLDKNLLDRWIDNKKYIIEEYIDWQMYTVNYYVDDNWKANYSPTVKVNSSRNIGIDDFSNYVRISWNIIDREISFEQVKIFLEKQIQTFWLKNTFIHHEFKLNSKWILKNIEINARIGWYRLEMMQNIYNFNLLEMPLWIEMNMNSDFSNAVFVFYPKTTWILNGFNEQLLEQFKNLKSYTWCRISNQKIWHKVWPTKDWFGSLVALRLKNTDTEQFKHDYDFVESKYHELIILDN